MNIILNLDEKIWLSSDNIVIEVNKEIISKNLWSNKNLEENDEIEIVTAVGGG